MLRASGGRYRDMEDAGLLVMVARVDCRYKSPARYDDLIEIRTRVDRVTAARIVHEYEITRESAVLVQATVTLAVVDREGRLQRVPDALVESFEQT